MGDLLQISSTRQGNGAYRYQAWIDNCLSKNRPWDEVVKTLLTAVGDPNDLEKGGPINYALDAPAANVQAELTAQRFLGLRLRCAQCHDHPFDVWTQDAYYGLASFFAKVQVGGGGGGQMMAKTTITINPDGKVIHLRTQKSVEPTLLDGKVVKVAAKEDPRKALVEWMIAPDNPYFSRAMANWVWAQLFSKGLVDPPDDMSRANPPVHPELLDALAKHFVAVKVRSARPGPDHRDLRDLRPFRGHCPGQRERHAALLAPSAAAADRTPDGRCAGPGDRRAQSLPGRRTRPAGRSTCPIPPRRARSSTHSAVVPGRFPAGRSPRRH